LVASEAVRADLSARKMGARKVPLGARTAS